jgi:hypothetical protein
VLQGPLLVRDRSLQFHARQAMTSVQCTSINRVLIQLLKH